MNKPGTSIAAGSGLGAKQHATATLTGVRGRRGAAAAHAPAVAGFRPAGLALAVAAAFLGAGAAFGQPVGASVVLGSASLQRQGNSLLVTTGNAPGTNRSVINWQSFSVPAGSTTQFLQPGAGSLSINRVTGSDPSAIYGTLSSNGQLVLVNPAGIAVGAGAVVDTAGFTASTLRMSDADALAGRLAFGDGQGGGPLRVEGRILARSGDVVLIAPSVGTAAGALVQAPNGAAILAAGQQVAITGRGLEGIQLQVQAPTDRALNLGSLQGDAVGLFAGQLRHSGQIQATAVSSEGGRVVLRASGDTLVDGQVTARHFDTGGSVDLLGDRVAVFGAAVIDASGPAGGGQVRIGGGLHGANGALPNASATFVGEGTTVRADATQEGDGGRVVVWADGSTRFGGLVSARGGPQGGNGGFVEVSGRQALAFAGLVDLNAPGGTAGTLLLDPNDLTIDNSADTSLSAGGSPFTFTALGTTSTLSTGTLNAQLALGGDVVVQTSANPALSAVGGTITVNGAVSWSGGNLLALNADTGIAVNAPITAGAGTLVLQAFGGTVTQTRPITVNTLAVQSLGDTTLTHAANSVNRLVASVGTANAPANFAFTNSSALTIDSVSTSLLSGSGTLSGVVANGGNVGIVAGAGDITVTAGAGPNGAGVTGAAVSLQAGGGIVLDSGIAATGLVSLKGGGDIQQGSGGAITGASLAVQSGGNVLLDASTGNAVGTLVGAATGHSAALGGGSYFSYLNLGSLTVGGSAIDGVGPGVTVNAPTAGYASGTLGGLISLRAQGTLTQAAGGVLTGAAAYLQGVSVAMNEANSVGSLGGLSTDGSFSFNSAVPYVLTAVPVPGTSTVQDGVSGLGVQLGSSNSAATIGQDALGTLATNGGGLLLDTPAVVKLNQPGNLIDAVATVGASAPSRVDITSGSLGGITLGIGSTPLTVNGPLAVEASAITVAAPVSANGIRFDAGVSIPSAGGTILVHSSLDSGSGALQMVSAGDIYFDGTLGVAGAGVATLAPGAGLGLVHLGSLDPSSSIAWGVNVAPLPALPSATPTTLALQGGTLSLVAPVTIPNLTVSGGTLDTQVAATVNTLAVAFGGMTGAAMLTVTDSLGWTGGSLGGSGALVLASTGTGSLSGGSLRLDRPLVNLGTLSLGNWTSDFPMSSTLSTSGGGSIRNLGLFQATGTQPNTLGLPLDNTGTGRLEVAAGSTLQLLADQFGTAAVPNAGTVVVDRGGLLDLQGRLFVNGASGTLAGEGTLAVTGGAVTNLGAISPGALPAGGASQVGTLTLDTPSLSFATGASLRIDAYGASPGAYDVLAVTGSASFANGVSVVPALSSVAGTPALAPGNTLDIVQGPAGGIGGSLPAVSGFGLAFVPTALRATLLAPPPPPPPPPGPPPAGLVEAIALLLSGDLGMAQAVVAQMDSNPLTVFSALLLAQGDRQGGTARTGVDALVDNNRCR